MIRHHWRVGAVILKRGDAARSGRTKGSRPHRVASRGEGTHSRRMISMIEGARRQKTRMKLREHVLSASLRFHPRSSPPSFARYNEAAPVNRVVLTSIPAAIADRLPDPTTSADC